MLAIRGADVRQPIRHDLVHDELRQRVVIGNVVVAHPDCGERQGDDHARAVLAGMAMNEHTARWCVGNRTDDLR